MTLARLLAPRSVAVVGASDRVGTYAEVTLSNLVRSQFPGQVIGIHPTRREALGFECVPALGDLPGPVDAVVIATPAPTVAQYVAQARAMGCGGAVVYAADFAESGNAEAQAALVDAAGDLPVIGPNGNGLVSVPARAPLWGDAVNLADAAGPIALVTQSGNVGVIALAHRRGLGLHTVVSVGNSAVTDSADVLHELANSDGVRVVALYLEDDGDGSRLATALAECADNDVRLVILKAGRSPAGAAAGAAHTAALAGDQRVFEALVREAGGVLVREPGELLETARALAMGRRSSGGVVLLTCSGGDATMAADIAHDVGARLTTFAPTTVEPLRDVLPPTATPVNPLDHTNLVWANTEAVASITEVCARDADAGHVVYVQDEPPGMPPHVAQEWADTRAGGVLGGQRAGVSTMLACTTPGQEPEGAVSGLLPLLTAIEALQRPAPSAARLRAIATTAAAVADMPPKSRALAEHQAKEILAGAGISVPELQVVESADEAVRAARELGLPVALKLSAPGLVHKSELGAVVVGLADLDAVRAAAERLLSITPLPDDAALIVESMAPPGVELFVAARSDGVVPTLVMGLGGVWAEALDDVVVIPLPASPARIIDALQELRGAPLLMGARGRNALAVEQAADVASRAANLLVDHGWSLVEMNPVIVSEHSAVAVDAVVGGK